MSDGYDWRNVMMAACLLSCSAACQGHSTIERADVTGSPLDRCIAKAYEGGRRDAGDTPPGVVAAVRSCVATFVKAPTVDRWATRLGPSIGSDAYRKGADAFVQTFVDCGARNGMTVAISGSDTGSRRIEARRPTTGMIIGSSDPDFLACANGAEKAERGILARAGSQSGQ